MTAAPEPTATITVRVDVAPPFAFELFTREMDQWWRRGPKYRHSGRNVGTLRMEPGLGGAITESWLEAGAPRTFELGRVTVWSPPERVVFTWRNATFAPFEATEVEVTFRAMGESTLVTVRHRGWEALRPDHPARHGQDDAAMQREVGLFWGELLASLRERALGP